VRGRESTLAGCVSRASGSLMRKGYVGGA